MVQNHNYFWINLIIYIGAHWSLILCKFHSVLWFFYYLKYKPICRGNGISFSRNGGIVNFQGPLHRNTISNTKTGTLKKIYNNQVNTELRRGKGNFRILGKFFSIYTFFCPIPSQPVVILKKAPYIPTVGHWPLVGKEQRGLCSQRIGLVHFDISECYLRQWFRILAFASPNSELLCRENSLKML